MEPTPTIRQDSPAWQLYVMLSFAISTGLMLVGLFMLPVSIWIKGYFYMGLFFTIGSTISLSKTLRDQHEGRKIINRLDEVKTEKILNDYNLTR